MSLLNSGLLMIPIPLNTRSLKLIPYLSLLTSARNGLIRTSSLTSKTVMVKRSVLSDGARNVTSPMTVPARGAMPQSLFYTGTMVPKASSCARSVMPVSPPLTAVFLCNAPLSPLQQCPCSQKGTQTLYHPQMRESKMPVRSP